MLYPLGTIIANDSRKLIKKRHWSQFFFTQETKVNDGFELFCGSLFSKKFEFVLGKDVSKKNLEYEQLSSTNAGSFWERSPVMLQKQKLIKNNTDQKMYNFLHPRRKSFESFQECHLSFSLPISLSLSLSLSVSLTCLQ